MPGFQPSKAAFGIKSFAILGTADADSDFAAGLFKAAPKNGNVKINPATDARFKVA